MNLISRKQAFALALTRFYTGRPCKHGHDCERYTSTGGCVDCMNASSKPWVIPKLLRGSAVPADSLRAQQILVEVPVGADAEQLKAFIRWIQHVASPHYFTQLGLRYGK